MQIWDSDETLFALARRELYTAVVGDIMDRIGLYHQFLSPTIKPLRDDMVVIGRAMPVLHADVFCENHSREQNPVMEQTFGLMLQALDDLHPNEVYLATGGAPRCALWGEIMSTRACKLGAVGAVLDGYSRDTPGVLKLGFPTFSCGRFAQDMRVRSKVIDFRLPVEIDRVGIAPGDILFGDLDGVCVVPRAAEEEVFRHALEKARSEKLVQQSIQNGMSSTEAFGTYGIL